MAGARQLLRPPPPPLPFLPRLPALPLPIPEDVVDTLSPALTMEEVGRAIPIEKKVQIDTCIANFYSDERATFVRMRTASGNLAQVCGQVVGGMW